MLYDLEDETQQSNERQIETWNNLTTTLKNESKKLYLQFGDIMVENTDKSSQLFEYLLCTESTAKLGRYNGYKNRKRKLYTYLTPYLPRCHLVPVLTTSSLIKKITSGIRSRKTFHISKFVGLQTLPVD